MPAVDLPPEIWHHIASFIPEDDLRKLYGLNRVFFDLAMRLMYREVYITSFNGKSKGNHVSWKRLLQWEPSTYGRFVHKVHLCLNLDRYSRLFRYFSYKGPFPATLSMALCVILINTAISLLSLFYHIIIDRILPLDAFFAINEWKTISKYSYNVRELSLSSESRGDEHSPYHTSIPFSLQMITIIFGGRPRCIGANVQNLTISGHDVVRICSSFNPAIRFPALTMVKIELGDGNRFPYHETRDNSDINIFTSFLNCLSGQLEHLEIRCHTFRKMKAPSSSSLARQQGRGTPPHWNTFIRLQTLKFTEFTWYTASESMYNALRMDSFLATNRRTLKAIHLQLSDHRNAQDTWFSPPSHVSYAMLQDLDVCHIQSETETDGLDNLNAMLRGGVELRNLTVRVKLTDADQLERLLRSVSSGGEKTKLKVLRIGVLRLDFEMIEILKHYAPELERLLVVWSYISEDFCEQCSRNVFKDWKLQEVEWASNYAFGFSRNQKVMEALKHCVPSANVARKAIEHDVWYGKRAC